MKNVEKVTAAQIKTMNAVELKKVLANDALLADPNLIEAIATRNAEIEAKQKGNGSKTSLYSVEGFCKYFNIEIESLEAKHRKKIRKTFKSLCQNFNAEPTKNNFDKVLNFFKIVMSAEKFENVSDAYTGGKEEFINPIKLTLALAKAKKFN